jgi:hypothetical protein
MDVFVKHHYLHFQKKIIDRWVVQCGSCTFTPKINKTLEDVIELVSCARNQWGSNWTKSWFYVKVEDGEDARGLVRCRLSSTICSLDTR